MQPPKLFQVKPLVRNGTEEMIGSKLRDTPKLVRRGKAEMKADDLTKIHFMHKLQRFNLIRTHL